MKYLLFAILGAAAILAIGATRVNPDEVGVSNLAAMAGPNWRVDLPTDNHDACLTPQENLDNKSTGDTNELILTVDTPDEIAKARKAFVERIGTTDSNIRPFDQIQIFKNGEVFSFDVFNTVDGAQCETTTFLLDQTEFDLWVQAGDVKVIGSTGGQIFLGYDPKKDMNIDNAIPLTQMRSEKNQEMMESIDTSVRFG